MNRIRVVLDTNVFLVSLAPDFRLHWIFTAIVTISIKVIYGLKQNFVIHPRLSQKYGIEK